MKKRPFVQVIQFEEIFGGGSGNQELLVIMLVSLPVLLRLNPQNYFLSSVCLYHPKYSIFSDRKQLN